MDTEIRDFRDLKVWQMAIELVPAVYEVVKRFPKTEMYALGDQLRRAVVSVPANIAEGQARQYTKEFVHYLSVARGSLAETETLLVVAQRLNYLADDKLVDLESRIRNLRRPLHMLMSRLRARVDH